MKPRQLQATWFGKRVASPLAEAVKEGLKSGNLVGEPKIGGYTVVPEGVVVEATVSVIVPPSKVLAEAPPKESLKLVFESPSLLTEVSDDRVSDIPFKALKDSQFSALVKKMGGLGQYSDEVLVALLEGRKKEGYEAPEDIMEIFYDKAKKDISRHIPEPFMWSDWGGGNSLNIKIKGGVVGGWLDHPVEWGDRRNRKELTIKRNIPDLPYIGLDPAIHGKQVEKGEKSTHPIFPKSTYWEVGGDAPRIEVIPKGTPGVFWVDVKRDWRLEQTPLSSLGRESLEKLVRWFAGE